MSSHGSKTKFIKSFSRLGAITLSFAIYAQSAYSGAFGQKELEAMSPGARYLHQFAPHEAPRNTGEKSNNKEFRIKAQYQAEEEEVVFTSELERQFSARETLSHTETLRELAESEDIFKDSESDWDIIKSIPADAWALIKAPAGWGAKEWMIASGVVTITALMLQGDKKVKDFVLDNRNEFTEEVSYYAEKGGNRELFGTLAATYVIGTVLKKPKLKRAMVLAFSSLLISGAITQGSKMLFARVRPNRTDDPFRFYGPGDKSSEYQSFPSGHTTAAFAVASSVASMYESKIIGILAYTAATLVGLSRIHDNKHWASDVIFGAAIGTATGLFITRKHKASSGNSFQLSPWVSETIKGKRSYGLWLTVPLNY